VDLLRIVDAARRLRGLAGEIAGGLTEPEWASSEEAFLVHFGASYEEYGERVSLLTPQQLSLLQSTLAVNPEAAVLWVLAMESS